MDAPGNQMRRATAILGAQRLYWTLSLCLNGPSRWRPPQVAPVARQGGGARAAARAAARRAARRPAWAQMAGWRAALTADTASGAGLQGGIEDDVPPSNGGAATAPSEDGNPRTDSNPVDY